MLTTKRHNIFSKITKTKKLSLSLLSLLSLVLALALSLAGCREPEPPEAQTEIRLNASVWQMMQGAPAPSASPARAYLSNHAPRRAHTYDNATALQTEGSFTAAAYQQNTTTAYISPVAANWSTDKWLFSDGKHYWPATGNLDFFAYMPAEKPSYMSAPAYTVVDTDDDGVLDAPQASFTCADLPMTYAAPTSTAAGQGSDLKEFVWGITVAQNKASQGASGVTMKFRHPFARIRFQLSASHPNIIINSITFKNLKTGGTCTLDHTGVVAPYTLDPYYYYTNMVWSSLTPAEGSSDLVMQLVAKNEKGQFVMTDEDDNIIVDNAAKFYDNPATAVLPIGGWDDDAGEHQYVDLLVVPQTFAGAIEVNAGWDDWGDTPVEHTVSTTIASNTWQAGKSYTYTFTITPEDLVVNVTNYTEQW